VVEMKERRLKTLMPTLREKERYIKFKIISENPIYYSDLEEAIWNTFLEFFGEANTAKLSLWLIKNLFDQKEQTAVLKCNSKSVEQIVAGLGLISRIGDSRIIIKILKVSGTLRGLK